MCERKDSVDAANTAETPVSENRRSKPRPAPDLSIRLDEHFRSHGARKAIVEARSGRRCTYAELGNRVEVLSRRLRRAGVGREVVVGALFDRRIELVVAALAILRAGGTYLPLDPGYPRRRLDAMVGDARPRLLLLAPAEHRRAIRHTTAPSWKPPPDLPRLVVDFERGPEASTSEDDPALDTTRPATGTAEGPLPLQAAYILFTSGSAGRPKGVVVSRGALSWYVDTAIAHYGLRPRDRLLQMASISFDISIGEIFPTLAAGATLVLDEGRPGDTAELWRRCRRLGITVLFPATALWHELARSLADDPGQLPSSLRLVSFGGEKVSPARLGDWFSAVGTPTAHRDRPELVNGYGPTEATVEASIQRIAPGAVADGTLIGRPIAGVRARVLGTDALPVIDPAFGELVLSSPGVARGYLSDPVLTASRFVPDPFSPTAGGRCYRTGDLVRWRGDRLEIAGRNDQQIKLRGLRVEISEIEHLLEKHPTVAAAAVAVATPQPGDPSRSGSRPAESRYLVAFIVEAVGGAGSGGESTAGEPGTTTHEPIHRDRTISDGPGILGVGMATAEDRERGVLTRRLREHLRPHLPAPLLPSRFVQLPRLPLGPVGKIDRIALARLARDELEARSEHPTGLEDKAPAEILEQIWRRILGLENLDPRDDFFELGGDSILALRVVSEARRRGLKINAGTLFAHPTIERLGGWLEQHHASKTPRPDVTEDGHDAKVPQGRDWAPLTPVQHWFFDRAVLAEPHHFNQSMQLVPARRLEAPRLRRILRRLVEHHEALRHRFVFDGGWRQHPARRETAEMLMHADLSHLATRHRADAHHRLANAVQASLDIGRGPVLRLALIELGAGGTTHREGSGQRLLIAIHHLVVDGVSWAILLDDLERLYDDDERTYFGMDGTATAVDARPTPLQKSLSYSHWAHFQQRYARSPEAAAELPYWLGRPTRASPLPRDSPAGREVDTLASESCESIGLDLGRSQSLLRIVPGVYGNRINDVLLTAVVRAVAPWSGRRDLLVDLEAHGREEIGPGLDLARTVGWFTATFPIHLRLPAGNDPGTALRALRDQLREVPHRGIGHGILYDLSPNPAVRGALRQLPQPEISFNYLGQLDALFTHQGLFEPAEEARGAERSGRGLRPYTLEIDGGIVGGRLWINWRYSRRLHRPSTVARLARRFHHQLELLIDHCVRVEQERRIEPAAGPTVGAIDGASDEDLPEWAVDSHPTTPLQEGILFHSLLSSSPSLYCEQNSWRFTGALVAGRFRQAWEILFERHPTLRSAFLWHGQDRPRQAIAPSVELPWHGVDLRALPPPRRRAETDRVLEAARHIGFALDRPPLVRLLWIDLEVENHQRRVARFAWIAHHLLLDGWSLASLFDELFTLYRGLGQGVLPAPRTRLPLGKVAEHLARLDPRRAEPFFCKYLEGFDQPTPISHSRVGPTPAGEAAGESSTGSIRRRQIEHRLEAELSRGLERWARERGLTLATVVQGLWGLLLARRSGVDDVVFGLVVNGRSLPLDGIDTTIGLLINTLPSRVRIPPDARLRPWLEALQREAGEVRVYEPTPLAQIRGWSGLEAESPLFESVLGFQNYPSHRSFLERQGKVEIGRVRSASEIHYPVVLAVLPEESLTLQLGWDPRRLDSLEVHRWVRQMARLLEAVGTAEDALRVAELPWLEPGEMHQLLVEWNDSEPGRDSAGEPPSLLQRIAALAAEDPHRPALRQVVASADGDEVEVGYGELARWVETLARQWLRRGVLPEQRIALLVEPSPRQIAALLATLATGGVFVPFDTGWPMARLCRMFRRSGADWLAADPELVERLSEAMDAPRLGLRRLPLGDDEDTVPSPTTESEGCRPLLERPMAGERLAYVLFTSGSTGEPKGVMINHRGLDNLVTDPTFGSGPGDVMLQLASPGFDASVWEIADALGHGATLELLPPGPPPAGKTLAELLDGRRISHALVPPSWLATLDSGQARQLPHLRRLLVGGEPCPPDLARRWAVGRQLVNAYGPTEITVCASATPLSPTLDRVSIGRPLRRARIHVVDPRLELPSLGLIGELVIAGPGLARGYLDDPAQTAARFVPDPFADPDSPGGRLYRTGDLGRRLPDGRLEMLGRRDHQVKIRGVRIELGEVEQALLRLQGIEQAAVTCSGEDGRPDRRLIAHLVPSEQPSPALGPAAEEALLAGWRRTLHDHLPATMVPNRILIHPRLPRSSSGKLDRRALETLATEQLLGAGSEDPGESAADGAPRDPGEALLISLWREVLGVPDVDRRQGFFELGGHSLLATQLVSRIRQVFGIDLPLRTFFEHPTVADLATELSRRRRGRRLGTRRRPPVPDLRRPDPIPLSFAQERLWFLHQLAPHGTAYNVPLAYLLGCEGGFGGIFGSLESALLGLVRRHEVLRTRLCSRDGRPCQEIMPPPRRMLSRIDLSHLPADHRERLAHRLLERDADTPFDLADPLLPRALWLDLAPGDARLLLHFHHIVFDGWSLGVLHQELATFFHAARRRTAPGLATLPWQYADFASWQRRWLDSETSDQLVEAWRRRHGGPGDFELPLDHPRPSTPRARGRYHRRTLPSTVAADLGSLAHRNDATPYMVLLAVFTLLLSRLSRRRRVVLGTPIANRNRRESEGLIGFFVNSLVLTFDTGNHPSLGSLIRQVRDVALDAFDLQDLPFEQLVEALHPERRGAANPLFQVSFALQNTPDVPLRLDGIEVEPIELAHPRIRFDLEVFFRIHGRDPGNETFELLLGQDADLFDPTTGERWTRALAELLKAAAEAEDHTPLDALPWWTPAERHQLLWEWGGDREILPSHITRSADDPWELFSRAAHRAPRATALLVPTPAPGAAVAAERWTFAELEGAARRLAAVLLDLGVGPETRVGVELERSPALLVAMLGVLASGAVFVPIDPGDPAPRRRKILEGSGLRVRLRASGATETADPSSEAIPSLAIRPADGRPIGQETLTSPGEAPAPASPPASARTAESSAYVIHTSGSTGAPKGVEVPRRILGRHLLVAGHAYGLGPADRVLWLATPGFDVGIEQMLAPLIHGAAVVVGPPAVLEAEGFRHVVESSKVTVANLPPALWVDLARESARWEEEENRRTSRGSYLRLVIVGGDAMPAGALKAWRRGPWHRARLLNAYGPTEAVITATLHAIDPATDSAPWGSTGLAIGRPLAGRSARVSGRGLDPPAAGVAGELYLGGELLARGYADDPVATALRFVPDPRGQFPGARCLRTGDRTRFNPRGELEMLGRIDRQIQIRGVRIEPGEVETTLCRHPLVGDAWVATRRGSRGEPTMVAWIAVDGRGLRKLGRARQVEHWRSVYDDLHRAKPPVAGDRAATAVSGPLEPREPPADPFAGWIDSTTGRSIPRPEMEDWLEQTRDRVLALGPGRLLELGCGHGLLLASLAPHTEALCGTDLSATALERLEASWPHREIAPPRTLCRPAHDFRELGQGTFDTVVLSSVVQYFPDIDYLGDVIAGAIDCLAPEGTLFLGDLRSLPLLPLLYGTAERLAEPGAERKAARQPERIRHALARRRSLERELVLDPFFFLALAESLPRAHALHLRPKEQRSSNELIRYRFDVSLWLDQPPSDERPRADGPDGSEVELDLSSGLDALEKALGSGPERITAYLDPGKDGHETEEVAPSGHRGIPWSADTGPIRSWDHLRRLLVRHPYWLDILWTRHHGIRLTLCRHPEASLWPLVLEAGPEQTERHPPWATEPSRDLAIERLVLELRSFVEDRLPPAMVPRDFVALDRLPRNPRGKVDSEALTWQPRSGAETPEDDLPRGTTEELVARRWCELLGIDSVGRSTPFFHLGGHSLLATRLVAWIRRRLGVEVELRWFFEHPTLAELASRIDADASARIDAQGPEAIPDAMGEGASPEAGTPRPGTLPLSHAQERLWFLDQLEPGNPAYHLSEAFELTGALDTDALSRAFEDLVRRHEVLRTRFPAHEGRPRQVIDAVGPSLAQVDLGALSRQARAKIAPRLRRSLVETPFDLARGPLIRNVLTKIGPRRFELVLVQHHIVSDGWSLGIVHRELEGLYHARTAGKPLRDPHHLPPLPLQYADFALDQRRHSERRPWSTESPAETGEGTGALDFWRRRLAGVEDLELPTDFEPAPGAPDSRGDTVPLRLPVSESQALGELGRRLGTSTFRAGLAAFAELLRRLTGQGDLAVGTPVAHRDRSELEDLIGFLVDTLVLRLEIDPTSGFDTLVAAVRDRVDEALAHRELPFDRLVELLAPHRRPDRNPFFRVTFALHDLGTTELRLHGVACRPLELELGYSQFDLELHLWPVDGAFEGFFAFRRALFARTTIQRFARHFATLVRHLVETPRHPLHQLDIFEAAERHQLTHEWGGTPFSTRSLPTSTDPLMGRLAIRHRQAPPAVVLAQGDRAWSWGALAYRCRALGRHLGRLGVGWGSAVAVCLEPSPEAVAVQLALWRSGATYVPLDPSLPVARLELMARQAKVGHLVVDSHQVERTRGLATTLDLTVLDLTVLDLTVLDLQTVDPDVETAEGGPPDVAGNGLGDPESWTDSPFPPIDLPAYCLFTSGSTGTPKAVVVSRRAFVSHLEAMARAHPLDSEDRLLQKTAPGFDPALWETWAPLLAGALLVVAGTESRRDPQRMCQLIEGHGITCLRTSPALLQMLCDRPELERCTTLRRVLCGGETLPPELVSRFRARGPGASLLNVYGPTEATINTVSQEVPPGIPDDGTMEGGSIPLGRPLPGSAVRVVDSRLRLRGVGLEGEIVLGGDNLAQGYAGQPGRTAEVFVPDPWSPRDRRGSGHRAMGGRLYRTGDRGRWTADGHLLFLGRRDRQIKLRGYRIELGEIEAALSRLPGIHEAVVVVRPLDGASSHDPVDLLVAFVVAEAGVVDPEGIASETRISAWQAHLEASLPRFMVPSHWVPLDQLPRTATGKLDLPALAAHPLGRYRGSAARAGMHGRPGHEAPPDDPRFEILHDVWCQVLGRPHIAADDDFFELGGHSLLATQVVSRLRRILDVDIPLASFFRHSTLAGLAASLPGSRLSPARDTLPLVPSSSRGHRPLSLAQQRLWFIAQLDTSDVSYNMPVVVELRGLLDPSALGRAWELLLERHQALRTVLPSASGQPYQRILRRGPGLKSVDLEPLGRTRGQGQAIRLAEALGSRPFDLGRGPLVRPVLLRLDAENHLLSLTLHHTLADGWSKGVILRELSLLYAEQQGGRPASLAPLPVQYADFAEWQRSWLDPPTLDRLTAAWRRRLEGIEPLRLPTDRPRPSRRTSRGAAVPLHIEAPVVATLRRQGLAQGATLFMTLMAVFMAWLHRLSDQGDIALATPIANRNRPQVEPLVGFFVNTLVMRGRFTARSTFEEMLHQVRHYALAAFDQQELPFDQVVAALRPQRDLGRNPLVDVAFALRYPQEPLPEVRGLEMAEIALPCRHAQFDLDLDLWSMDEGIEGLLTFRRDLFDTTTVIRWARQLEVFAGRLAEAPDRPIDVLDATSPAERHQLLAEWRTPGVAPAELRPLHHHVSRIARHSPGAPALEWEEADGRTAILAYGPLAHRALLLADRLQRMGVGTETRVGIFLPKSPEAITAILAVMAAGGTWVPLDPEEPTARLAAFAESLGLRFAITRGSLAAELPWRPPVVATLDRIMGDAGPSPYDVERGARLLDQSSRWESWEDSLDGRLAYIIQTSGSTGRPKAVAIDHRSWATVLEAWRREYRLAELKRHLQAARIMFDVFAGDLARALGSGAALVLCPRDVMLDPSALAAFIDRHRIDAAELVPSVARRIADVSDEPGASVPRSLEQLGLLAVGSEVVTGDDLRSLRRAIGPRTRLVNSYGLSEAAIDSTWYLDDRRIPPGDSVPIGRPFPGVHTLVLGRSLQLLPVGCPGELAIAGPLARGYLGQPSLTARRFVPHPFPQAPGDRLYRTGDRARFRADGQLELLGRLDRQIKIRGARIEPAEVEWVLLRVARLREAAVAVKKSETDGAAELMAWLVPLEGARPSIPALRRTLRRHLPPAMIPTRLEVLAQLPRTSSGKVDHRTLLAELGQGKGTPGSTPHSPPRGRDERAVAAIWKKLLGEEVDREADFFALGGHSLMVVRLIAEVTARCGVRLMVAEVFQNPRLRDLARLIGRRRVQRRTGLRHGRG